MAPKKKLSSSKKKGASADAAVDDLFVTQPPKRGGLTGKISTLFRRETRKAPKTTVADLASPSELQRQPSTASSVASRLSQSKRIFYSHDDDDDSYESRSTTRGGSTRASRADGSSYRNDGSSYPTDTDHTPYTHETFDLLRYRGFSTSIQSLFLDEPLVCASMGCFGLILSQRTEHLLDVRNTQRGNNNNNSRHGKKRLPSRLVAWGLLVIMLLMFSTFMIWGFGDGQRTVASEVWADNNEYDNGDDDANDDVANDDGGQWWDDYLNNNNRNDDNGGDDNYNGDNGNNNNDQQQYYYDDGNNNNADDYAVNDDANNNNYQNNNDGNNYGDDAQANVDDDAVQYNDDAQNDDYYYANDDGVADDYYYAAEDDDYYNNRQRVLLLHQQAPSWHRPTGVCKMRDSHEWLWQPVIHFVQEEVRLSSRQLDDAATQEPIEENVSFWESRDLASDIRILLLFLFLLFLGIVGRRRRMRTRFYIVRARAQEDHLYYASSGGGPRTEREDQYEGACSHTLCGCYPVDDVTDMLPEQVAVTDDGLFRRKRQPHHEDSVARAFNCLMGVCCGWACRCWFQCLSVCAIAQEAREIRLLLPPRYQRIDFITHQPFREYQRQVNDLRRGWLGRRERLRGMLPHYEALSRLSRYILVCFFLSAVAIVATLVFNPRAAFSWQDAVVLVATFCQSFLVLFIVHWIFHKSDLSLDAVIKFYAAGFLIAVPTAIFFEGLIVNLVIMGAGMWYYLLYMLIGIDFGVWVFDHQRVIWIVGELFNAYVVAAITEELCKYYTFRAVEHPDLIFLTGLQRESQDESAMEGGLVKYPFASHAVQDYIAEDDASTRSGSTRGSRRRRPYSSREQQLLQQQEFEEDENDVRTYRQKAMAITTAMISVAVGLACAENVLYVFLLGGALGNQSTETRPNDDMEAWIVLFFRSIFPIHALAAAMQSVNVIRKFVESSDQPGGHRIGVGRIILPAVILHGTFDAILMGINVFVETAWDSYLRDNEGNITDEDPYNAFVVNLVAWVSITVTMFLGILWYVRENRAQRLRLILLEEQTKALVDATCESTVGSWTTGTEGQFA